MTRTVLVTGANGFLGGATARYFALQGWKTYGFIRNASSASKLIANEIIPVIGDYSNADSIKGLSFDVIVSVTEDNFAYEKHFAELIELFKAAAQVKKPLILFTSGNKDYGQGDANHWMSEDSPLNPPGFLQPRCFTAPKIFEYKEWHAALIRPCMIYGYTGSYYASILAQGALKDTILIDGSPEVIWHGVHVDDVASAYFHIATKRTPEEIHGKVFTVSNDNYDTFKQLAECVAAAYGGKSIEYREYKGDNVYRQMSAFSQALKSERLRSLGWRPLKMGFSEGVEVYKAAFDEALKNRDPAVVRLVKAYLGPDAL